MATRTLPTPISDVVYLATQIEQIEHDYEESGSNEELNTFAMEWVEENAEEFSYNHPRISRLVTDMTEMSDLEFFDLHDFCRLQA
jgi:hypothetical protein